MPTRVLFGAPTALSHRPDPAYQPPQHYAGLVNPASTLKTTQGGYTIAWNYNPGLNGWFHPEYLAERRYLDDGTYEVWHMGLKTETGTWTAVA